MHPQCHDEATLAMENSTLHAPLTPKTVTTSSPEPECLVKVPITVYVGTSVFVGVFDGESGRAGIAFLDEVASKRSTLDVRVGDSPL